SSISCEPSGRWAPPAPPFTPRPTTPRPTSSCPERRLFSGRNARHAVNLTRGQEEEEKEGREGEEGEEDREQRGERIRQRPDERQGERGAGPSCSHTDGRPQATVAQEG